MKIKNILLACLTGIGIGMPITVLCMALIGGWNDAVKEILVWLVASALFGVLSLIFNSGKLNLILSTAIHCAGCLAVTCTACTINGYSDNFFEMLFAILPVFVVVYVVIYTSAMISAKKEAKKITESLNK
ncbi:MAG: DUF3021 domain-containing protein [Ruminococcus sp.]|nr:DUF3021 domain-containing protein [Ruminococcus sp.]